MGGPPSEPAYPPPPPLDGAGASGEGKPNADAEVEGAAEGAAGPEEERGISPALLDNREEDVADDDDDVEGCGFCGMMRWMPDWGMNELPISGFF